MSLLNQKNLFNEDYFERGIELGISGYSYYRWMPEFTIPMCFKMIQYLGIKEEDRILDFGCAKGYLVKAFRLLHFEAYGFDISDYALDQAPRVVEKYLYRSLEGLEKFDWIIAKDVLEHIDYKDIDYLLKTLLKSLCNNMFCIIPLGNSISYNVHLYDKDITHVIKESMKWWVNKFKENDFDIIRSTYAANDIKENYAHYEKGNGFFVLKSKEIV